MYHSDNALARGPSLRFILRIRQGNSNMTAIIASVHEPTPEPEVDEELQFFNNNNDEDDSEEFEDLDSISEYLLSDGHYSKRTSEVSIGMDEEIKPQVEEIPKVESIQTDDNEFGGGVMVDDFGGATIEEDVVPLALEVVQPVKKRVFVAKKSPIENLPEYLQSEIFGYLPLVDINSILTTCKTFSTHQPAQITRSIILCNVYFRKRLLRFTYSVKLLASPAILVDELNVLQRVSSKLAKMFTKVHTEPHRYVKQKALVQDELRSLLEYRKLFGMFVNIVDLLLGLNE